MRIVDTHVHLDEVQDSEGALGRARDAGIQAIVAVGMDRRSNERTLSLAQKYPGFVYPAVGYHPWRLQDDDLEANFSLLETELPH
ncbi:MAG: TatD family hydrolase, partial [Deltaproteobacteria bacterium]|nr:TatD family hydrolase [Deltaproteobacteria bacterium]